MSSAEPETSSPNALRELLLAWISTDTWNESLEQLKLHADELLNEHALQELDTLLAGTTDEERRETLQQHRKLLEVARAESPDAAYAEIMKPPPIDWQMLPDSLHPAMQALLAASNSVVLSEVLEQYPLLLASETIATVNTFLGTLRQSGQERAAEYILSRYRLLQQINLASQPLHEALANLFQAWIETESWGASRDFLKANAEALLQPEALDALNILLARNAHKGEGAIKTLLQHRALLQQARDEDIDAAYAELLKPSPLTRAIQTLSVELSDAVQAVVMVRNAGELREQVEKHPILLTSEGLTAIETLISNLLAAGQENAAKHVSARYDILKQINDPLNLALNALLNATPTTLHKVTVQHPILLDEETQQAFANAALQIEQGGDAATARKIRLLLTEVQRRNPQDARRASPPIDVSQREPHHPDGPTTIGARGGSVAAGEIRDSVVTTHTYHSGGDRLPEKRWLCPPLEDFGDKPFIGREEELETLLTHLKAGEHVAITGTAAALQGMAGIGKTFLARKLAMELRPSFPESVIFLTLGEQVVDEPSVQALLRQLASCTFGGLAPAGQLYPGTVAAWLKEVAPRRLLVIFDDVWSQEALRVLSRALPDETIRLITTRFADIGRQIQGEPYVLDRLTDEDGLALLEGRLDCRGDLAYRPFLQNLVKLLDGHALALEIAAARMKPSKNARPTAQDTLFAARKLNRVQTVCESLQKGIGRGNLDGLKLGRGQERDDNVEKSLGLSYESMTPEQQRRFRALGVFSAETPITAQAAAAIWRQEEHDTARDEMAELVDLALLTEVEGPTATSYRQHGLLQVYARALLEKESELTSTSWAHAQYYTDLVWQIEAATPQDYSLLDLHMQNLLRALQWTRRQEPVLFSRLIDGLEQFLRIRGQIALLEEYLPEAEKIASSTGNRGRQANVRWSLGDLESHLGHLDEARAHYDAALPLFKQVSNRLGEANVHQSLGDLERRLGVLDGARAHYDEALPLFKQVSDRLGEANVRRSLGDLERRLGHLEEARAHYDAALPLYQTERDRLGEANVHQRLGDLALRLGHLDEARAHYDAALPLFKQVSDRLGEANVRRSLGDLERRLGHLEEARAHYDAALPLFKQVSDRLGEANVYMRYGDMHLAQKVWSEARNAYEQALPLFVAEQEPLGEANTLINLGLARFELGDHEQGMLDVQRAAALFLFTRSPEWVQRAERRLAEMRARLEQPEVRELLAFAAADWTWRRQMLSEQSEHASFLLTEQVEPAFDALMQVTADAEVVSTLEEVRTLLRRCRTWGVDAVFYFELQMRLGDAIALPAQDEPAVMQVATLLARQGEDAAALEQAVEIMETLLNRLTAATPPLFEAALLRDLAQALLALPTGHPLRRLDQIEAYYREALPLYAAAERVISVAFLQRALGELLSELGRYEEALPCLQAAIQELQAHERYQSEVAQALSSYASALEKLGQIAEALVAYDRAIALLPETPLLLRNRAETLIHARRLEEAEVDLAQAVELDGHEESSYLWFRRAQLAIARGDGSLATTLLDEVLKRDPSHDVRFLRAQSAWLCGDHSSAQAELQRAFSGASAGEQATMRRELQRVHDEHPDLPNLAVEA